jgi:rubrerythrin
MDIFEFGMQMEKDGEAYYRELAGKSNDKGLETIFTMLADDEVRHYNVLKELAEGAPPRLSETKILSDIKNIFVKEKEAARDFDFNISQIDLYKKAQDLEKRSEDFYLDKSGSVEGDTQKEIFEKIAREEKRHYWILENIIELVSRPETWLENAEWHHLEEY